MECLNKKLLSSVRYFVYVAMAIMSMMGSISCSSDGDEDDGLGKSGFAIVGTATKPTGAAVVSCDGRAQSISLIFKVNDSYEVITDGSDWLSIVSGGAGEAGMSQSLKLHISENAEGGSRVANVYIKVGDNELREMAEITQSSLSIEAVVKWMDTRLVKEYYWLEAYCKAKDAGKINYDLRGQEFLNKALLGLGSVNRDDGYVDANGERHLFSYISEYSASRALAGTSAVRGYGFDLCYTIISFSDSPNYAFLLEHVYPGSPAEMMGFQRGDMIMQVNGNNINGTNYTNLFNTLQSGGMGAISVGKRETMSDGSKKIVTYDVASGEYYKSPIACSMILSENEAYGFDFGDKKIGYISYLSFDSDYDDELIESMKKMEQEGVTDLIIDLRNNGGGAVYSSSYFASMILSSDYVGKTMVVLERNVANENGNDEVPFVGEVKLSKEQSVELPHLNLQKVYFITSDNTASASEMLIMGLRAQGVEAVTIGTQSLGKDCGMDVMRAQYGAKTYEYAPITFMNRFENYDVSFADGIPADIDFSVLVNEVADEDLKGTLDWYPLPELSVGWGDYLGDIALAESVANILGGTIFPSSGASARFTMPHTLKTRASAETLKRGVELERPAIRGMYVTHPEIIEIKE